MLTRFDEEFVFGTPVGIILLDICRKSEVIYYLEKLLCSISLNTDILNNIEQKHFRKLVRERMEQVRYQDEGPIIFYSRNDLLKIWYSREMSTEVTGRSYAYVANIIDNWKPY